MRVCGKVFFLCKSLLECWAVIRFRIFVRGCFRMNKKKQWNGIIENRQSFLISDVVGCFYCTALCNWIWSIFDPFTNGIEQKTYRMPCFDLLIVGDFEDVSIQRKTLWINIFFSQYNISTRSVFRRRSGDRPHLRLRCQLFSLRRTASGPSSVDFGGDRPVVAHSAHSGRIGRWLSVAAASCPSLGDAVWNTARRTRRWTTPPAPSSAFRRASADGRSRSRALVTGRRAIPLPTTCERRFCRARSASPGGAPPVWPTPITFRLQPRKTRLCRTTWGLPDRSFLWCAG